MTPGVTPGREHGFTLLVSHDQRAIEDDFGGTGL